MGPQGRRAFPAAAPSFYAVAGVFSSAHAGGDLSKLLDGLRVEADGESDLQQFAPLVSPCYTLNSGDDRDVG